MLHTYPATKRTIVQPPICSHCAEPIEIDPTWGHYIHTGTKMARCVDGLAEPQWIGE